MPAVTMCLNRLDRREKQRNGNSKEAILSEIQYLSPSKRKRTKNQFLFSCLDHNEMTQKNKMILNLYKVAQCFTNECKGNIINHK